MLDILILTLLVILVPFVVISAYLSWKVYEVTIVRKAAQKKVITRLSKGVGRDGV